MSIEKNNIENVGGAGRASLGFGQTLGMVGHLNGNMNSKSVPVLKWGIIFSGQSERTSVGAFLQRVEELRVARNKTKE